MGRNLQDFYFNLFGIDPIITPSNANDSVAFQSFTFSWNLNKGYKTLELNLQGNPTGRSAKAPEKGTIECPTTELTGEMFCYQRKKLS